MEHEHQNEFDGQKKSRLTTREINTPLLLLRAAQMGVSIRDLDLLTIGMVNDMAVESANDDFQYPIKATQDDINKFFG